MGHDAETHWFDEGTWAPPVETLEDLWHLAPEGQMCFVKSENRVYQRVNGAWTTTTEPVPKPDRPAEP